MRNYFIACTILMVYAIIILSVNIGIVANKSPERTIVQREELKNAPTLSIWSNVNSSTYVWPKPQSMQAGKGITSICDRNYWTWRNVGSYNGTLLQNALDRYTTIIFNTIPVSHEYAGPLCTFNINIISHEETITIKTDESYKLEIYTENAFLSAYTFVGALRGLETFVQLINDNLQIPGIPISIVDYPDYPWRGLLVDTSRHYISFRILRRIVDSLSYAKMNVFHWHIVDAQSFPFEVKAFPGLHRLGSYEFPTTTYFQHQIKNFMEYARQRGVRVILEIDFPGHARSWGRAYPNIIARCPMYDDPIIDFTPLNPAENLTYQVLTAVVTEASDISSDSYIHLGGDEVKGACYRSNGQVEAWFRKTGLTDWNQIQVHLMSHGMEAARRKNKNIIIWEDMLKSLPEEILSSGNLLLHFWLRMEMLPIALKKNIPVIISSPWYLDRQVPGKPRARFHDSWMDFYSANIDTFVKGYDEKLLYGGEACAWSEHMDDANIENRIWPRTAAVAEKLWNRKQTAIANDTKDRLNTFSCLLRRRGVPSGPGIYYLLL